MQLSFAATLFTALVGLTAISPVSAGSVIARVPQNGNRPVPVGDCCTPNTSLKQDTCTTTAGAEGRCVPGGEDCGGALSCIATPNLVCDNDILERGKPLCRAPAENGGVFDGAKVIQDIADANVN